MIIFQKNCIFVIQSNRLGKVARVVEWDGLENRCTGNCTVSSNLTLSANEKRKQNKPNLLPFFSSFSTSFSQLTLRIRIFLNHVHPL
jgi:hypothetical protein